MPLSDRASNNHALEFGEEILSTFPFGEGDQQVGVMTESDRSYTFIFILDPTTQNVA
jgi:methylglyoxal synthase